MSVTVEVKMSGKLEGAQRVLADMIFEAIEGTIAQADDSQAGGYHGTNLPPTFKEYDAEAHYYFHIPD